MYQASQQRNSSVAHTVESSAQRHAPRGKSHAASQKASGLQRPKAVPSPSVNTTTIDTIYGMLTAQVNDCVQSALLFGSPYCSTAAHSPLLTAAVASRTRPSWRWWRRPAGSSGRQLPCWAARSGWGCPRTQQRQQQLPPRARALQCPARVLRSRTPPCCSDSSLSVQPRCQLSLTVKRQCQLSLSVDQRCRLVRTILFRQVAGRLMALETQTSGAQVRCHMLLVLWKLQARMVESHVPAY